MPRWQDAQRKTAKLCDKGYGLLFHWRKPEVETDSQYEEGIMLSLKVNREKWIALIVAAAMLLMAPLQSRAGAGGNARAAEKGKYVSEVYTAYGKDEAAAKKVLEDKGYSPVDGSLNLKGKTYVMLGYKTTDDKAKAVKDLALMNSRGGYSVGDYENMLKEKKNDIAAYLTGVMDMVKEYRVNYAKKDPKAIMVHETLNNFIDDDSGKRMGDLLLGDTLQDKVGIKSSVEDKNKEKLPDLVTIFMQGNAMNLNTIVTELGMATGKTGESTVDEFADKTTDDLKKEIEKKNPDMSEAKQEQQLKGRYDDAARLLAAEAKLMAKELKEYEKSGLKLENADAEDIKKKMGEAKDVETAKDVKRMNDNLDWASTAVFYEALKNYEGGQFKKGELLQFILDSEDNDDPERFYPLVASLTKGEKFAKTKLSLKAMLLGDMPDEKDMKEAVKEEKKNIKKMDDISVYNGVDRDIYLTDGTVALTDEAKRKKADALAVDQYSKQFWDDITFAAAASWSFTAVSLVGYLNNKNVLSDYAEAIEEMLMRFEGKLRVNFHVTKEIGTVNKLIRQYGSVEKAFRENVKTVTIDDDALDILGNKSVDDFFSNDYKRAVHLDRKLRTASIFKYATIALALISAGLTVAALIYKSEADLPPVPKYMVDSKEGKDGKNRTINYIAAGSNGLTAFKAEKKNKGPYADTKAYEGSQWLTIYQTKDGSAGKPIAPDFLVKENKKITGDYELPLHIIGEKGATNLINDEYMNYSKFEKLKNKDKAVYVFFKTQEDQGFASAFSGGMIAIIAICGVAVIALIAALVRRSKKNSVN